MYNVKYINDYVKKHLSLFRYNHSLLVAQAAKSLAQIYGLDESKAYITGLLHDIAKEFTDEENKYYIDKYNIDLEYTKDALKPVLHGIVGSYFVKEKFNMDDEVCNAIKYHTLGNKNMTLFDKIILVSDKIGRTNKDQELISLAHKDIDKALIYIFDKQEKKLKSMGKTLHSDTIELLNSIIK